MVALQVLEVDPDGHRTCCVSFDADSLERATVELDERWLALLDLRGAFTALRCFDRRDALASGNIEAVAALMHGDVKAVRSSWRAEPDPRRSRHRRAAGRRPACSRHDAISRRSAPLEFWFTRTRRALRFR